MKHVMGVLLCACALALPSQVQAAPRRGRTESLKSVPNWFWGCWVVKNEIPVATTSTAVSSKEAKAIIGTRVIYTPTSASSGRTVVSPASYSVKVLSATGFTDEYYGSANYVELKQIGIHNQHVTEVELALPDGLSDFDFPGNDVYLRKDDIVIEVENAFFVAEKAKPGDSQCVCTSPAGNKKRRQR